MKLRRKGTEMNEAYEAYNESIQKGVRAARALIDRISEGEGTEEERTARLSAAIKNADAILIGAGAGLSTAAGFTYSGERFSEYFFDFAERFGITDMYSGGFYPFPDEQTLWAWWARHIYINRYVDPPKPVYEGLKALVSGRDYFVITTNVDHCFQRACFDKNRLFYTQGDYGLFQSADGRDGKTFDNEEWVKKAMAAQRFIPDENGVFRVPKDRLVSMRIPKELIPKTLDGKPVKMNLRSDDTFVEDAGWHRACRAYTDFLAKHESGKVLYLELGVGGNTPVIIKFPFWQRTLTNPEATYACVNYGEAFCPADISDRSICINADLAEVIHRLK
ncbi:MAG: hypothetical protein IKG85_03425 [Clostridia bacterium]|nr:hypothetical protein [Clostridia bacterium]